jgi:hypothetical protein
VNGVRALIEGVATLSYFAGYFASRGESDAAHRCDQAAGKLEAFLLDLCEEIEAEEAEESAP